MWLVVISDAAVDLRKAEPAARPWAAGRPGRDPSPQSSNGSDMESVCYQLSEVKLAITCSLFLIMCSNGKNHKSVAMHINAR